MIIRTFLNENKQLESGKWIPANLEYYRWYRIGAIVSSDKDLDKIKVIFETLYVTHYSRRTNPFYINYSKELICFDKDMDTKNINEALLNYDIIYDTVDDPSRIKEEYGINAIDDIPIILKNNYGMENGDILVKFYGNISIK